MPRMTNIMTLIRRIILAGGLILLAATGSSQNMGDKMLDLLQQDHKPEAPLIPPETKIVPEYKEGMSEPAGLIEFVENEAFVIHAEEQGTAYRARKNGAVSIGDILVAEESSRLVVLFKDQSRVTIAAYTKLVIDKSVYDPDRNLRDTVLDLVEGKARVVAKKLQTAGEENYKIRTPVATCGIRGSDFVVSLVPKNKLPDWRRGFLDDLSPVGVAHAQSPGGVSLVVLTGADTRLSVTGNVGPPVIMESFSVTAAFADRPVMPPSSVAPGRVPDILNKVGPNISVMGMPGGFE